MNWNNVFKTCLGLFFTVVILHFIWGGDNSTTKSNSWDQHAVEYVVKQRLQNILKDPSSLEIISCREVRPSRSGKQPYGADVTYRAKNSFGGYVVETIYIE